MDSKRIAVLISGEYRTFDICRPTMTFLDDPRVDVYFSTWDRTIVKNEILGIDINEEITFDRVHAALGKDACVLIEKSEGFVERRYNSKMIHRWKTGFEMVRQSGVEYDYVLVVRPDLYFNTTVSPVLCWEWEINTFYCLWGCNHDNKTLNDPICIASYSKMVELTNLLSMHTWADASETDWHKWWYSTVTSIFSDVLPIHWDSIFARVLVTELCNYQEIQNLNLIWAETAALNQIQNWGQQYGISVWGQQRVQELETYLAAGKYLPYASPRIHLLLVGSFRTGSSCYKQWTEVLATDVSVITTRVDTVENVGYGYSSTTTISDNYVKQYYPNATVVVVDDVQGGTTTYNLFNKWKIGLDTINGNPQDIVVLSRPDLYLFDVAVVNNLIRQCICSQIVYMNVDHSAKLGNDIFMIMPLVVLNKLIQDYQLFDTSGDLNFMPHEYLYDYSNKTQYDNIGVPGIIVRPNYTNLNCIDQDELSNANREWWNHSGRARSGS